MPPSLFCGQKISYAEAVNTAPEASITWAGVRLIHPLLTNLVTAQEANRDGFVYVSRRMSYYSASEPFFF